MIRVKRMAGFLISIFFLFLLSPDCRAETVSAEDFQGGNLLCHYQSGELMLCAQSLPESTLICAAQYNAGGQNLSVRLLRWSGGECETYPLPAADGAKTIRVYLLDPQYQPLSPVMTLTTENLSLSAAEYTLLRGETVQLSLNRPDGEAITADLSWNSADSAVCTVSESGLVTALSSGQTVITAEYAGTVLSCTVTVHTPEVLLVLNTDLDPKQNQPVTFDPVQTETYSESLYSLDISGDSSAEMLELHFPDPIPDPSHPQDDGLFYALAGSEYLPGMTKHVPNRYDQMQELRCLYIGEHCTVWGAVGDAEAITVTETEAALLAEAFDSQYSRMADSFGDWYDADGDGKLAILCYDIDANYGNGEVLSYVGGFFRSADLLDADYTIGPFHFKPDAVTHPGMDCIHIDTYPGMGREPLAEIPKCYSTLFHEYQHLISFSYQVSGEVYCNAMDTYLNEAFSMGAEHLLMGSESTETRVAYFNSASYIPGTSLTCWANNLSAYANSYLFGQYLRTRYAQLTGTDGSTVYRELLHRYFSQHDSSSLELAAALLETDAALLVRDFWTAIYRKADTGPYGFAGEAWADAVQPRLQTPTGSCSVSNGSCRYYTTDTILNSSIRSGLLLRYLCADSDDIAEYSAQP